MSARHGFSEKPFGPQQPQQATAAPPKTNGHDKDKDDWPKPEIAAYHGLAGEVVTALLPHTESDPVALLVQYLASFGNVIGRGPYFQVENDQHFGNIFAILVGESSKSRKGTSAGRIRRIFESVDSDWAQTRICGGMSSGEGVLMQVRDEVMRPIKGVMVVVDVGVSDKRLLLDEREFFQALAVMRREGNILSRIIRDAWDCREIIATLTKNSPIRATRPFISIIGHITGHELLQMLDRTSMANGYANRFLFICVRRSKSLPHGGAADDEIINALGTKTLAVVEAARPRDRLIRSAEANKLWEEVYPKLSEGGPGLLGAITGRAEAQTMRLALLYALLDASDHIEKVHLEAGLALWTFCDASARRIFGDLLGDTLADEILRALRTAGAQGMSRSDMHGLFNRNRSGDEIGRALQLLLTSGRVRFVSQPAKRGPWLREIWYAV